MAANSTQIADAIRARLLEEDLTDLDHLKAVSIALLVSSQFLYGWTGRSDDAKRITDVIYEISKEIECPVI